MGRRPGGGYGGNGQAAKAGGGGYGGRGANAATVDGTFWGGTYGSAYAPYLPSSSGGCVENHSPDAGGAIRILCDGTLTMNGALTASSPHYPLGNWGCGASGSAVWVICRSFKGTNPAAKIEASGSDGWNPIYLAGGGGRLAVWMGVRPRTTGTHIAKLLAEETGAAFATEQPASWAGTTSAAAKRGTTIGVTSTRRTIRVAGATSGPTSRSENAATGPDGAGEADSDESPAQHAKASDRAIKKQHAHSMSLTSLTGAPCPCSPC